MDYQKAKKLKWGDKLKPSNDGLEKNLGLYKGDRAIFLKLDHDELCVKLIKKNRVYPIGYHIDFWDKIEY